MNVIFTKETKNYEKFLIYSVIFVSFLIALTGRTGQELRLLNYRIGEIFIAFAFLGTLAVLFFYKLDKVIKIFFIYNLILVIFTFSYPISFRLSSFVWSISFFYILDKKLIVTYIFKKKIFFLLFCQNILFSYNLISPYKIFPKYFNATEQVVVIVFFISLILNIKQSRITKLFTLIFTAISIVLILNYSRAASIALLVGTIILLVIYKEKETFIFVFSLFTIVVLFFNAFQYLDFSKLSITNDFYQYSSVVKFSENQNIYENNELVDILYSEAKNKEYFMTPYFLDSQFFYHYYKNENSLSCNNSMVKIFISPSDVNFLWRVEIIEDILNCKLKSLRDFLFGSGYENIMIPLDNYWRMGNNLSQPNTSAHNIFLQAFYHGGILNFILFLFVLFKINFLKSAKYSSPTLIAFIISGSFGVVFETVNQLLFWFLIFIEKESFKINEKIENE